MKTGFMHQVYMGTVGDMKNLEQHYADMVEKGWMIDKIGLFTHRYRAVEPCKKRFFVDFLPQITAFDYPENEDAQDYRRICEESGWNFISANKQFHVFCADDENPVPIPIHTDNSIHARIYLKASRKYELPWLLLATLMFGINSPLRKDVELFLSNIYLFMTIGYLLFLIGCIWTLVFVICWYIRTRKSAKNDLPMPKVNRHFAYLRNKVMLTGTIALLACMITGVVLEVIGGMSALLLPIIFMPLIALIVGLWIRRQVDTKRRTRAGNIALTVAVIVIMEIVFLSVMAFAITNIPFKSNSDSIGNRPVLTLSDVGVTAESKYYGTQIRGTIAVPVDYDYFETSGDGSVHTQVYRTINRALAQSLYDHFALKFTEQFAWRLNGLPNEAIMVLSPDEAAFWGADKGVRFIYANSNAIEVLLWNEKTVLRLSAEGLNMDFDTISQAIRGLWEE
jgi:hypothetical protein